jgi:CheY-like chemotaxis protein
MRPILVVDDEFDISEVICTILQTDGYEVQVCANGKEAIAYLKDHAPPCLVILDVMMPFANGYEVLRFMRGSEGLKSIPVILMSAVTPAMKQADFGWNDFLRKPFTLESLEELVAKHARSSEAPS